MARDIPVGNGNLLVAFDKDAVKVSDKQLLVKGATPAAPINFIKSRRFIFVP